MPALSRRPAGLRGLGQTLFTWFGRARDYYFALPRPKFEAMTLGLALLAGLIMMPVLIYIAGIYMLKAYANGGVLALFYDFYKGLVDLRPSCWIVLIGPFVFLSFVRLSRLVLRKL
jgi:hypothetical protein